MRKLLKLAMQNWIYAADDESFCDRFNFVNQRRWKRPVRLEFVNDNFVLKSIGSDSTLTFARKSRMQIYMHHLEQGVESRLRALAADYMCEDIQLSPGDVILDCGANVGELGCYLTSQQPDIQYIGIEPSAPEAECLKINNPGAKCIQSAAWDTCGEMSFYDKNDSGDSSLIDPGGAKTISKIPTTTLDKIADSLGVANTKILKIEAEGGEPEVLKGALETLKRTQYVCVDCGPERGIENKTTAAEVCRILLTSGFQLDYLRLPRCTFRFSKIS